MLHSYVQLKYASALKGCLNKQSCIYILSLLPAPSISKDLKISSEIVLLSSLKHKSAPAYLWWLRS